MVEEKKYKLGEEFLEITFQIPKSKEVDIDEIHNGIIEIYGKDAVNIKVIPCKIVEEPPRLSVSKDDYSYTIWNSKQESQIIESKEVSADSSQP